MDIKKPRIVAVDVEKEFASMLKEYFELRGYDINVSSKAVEGIELINQKKPDVVILDLKMPGISGDEVLKVLKLKQPDIKVIFVTAFDDGGKTKKNLLALGAYAYLDKPINSLKELEDIIIKTNK